MRETQIPGNRTGRTKPGNRFPGHFQGRARQLISQAVGRRPDGRTCPGSAKVNAKTMNVFEAVKNVVIGRARSLSDKSLFHKTSLIALLAWVGLGADGLSSSCYGPEAAFLALKEYHYLSLFVAGAVILTIVVICASYS